jgi:hypothetical protein
VPFPKKEIKVEDFLQIFENLEEEDEVKNFFDLFKNFNNEEELEKLLKLLKEKEIFLSFLKLFVNF